jgi:hypothetical protein
MTSLFQKNKFPIALDPDRRWKLLGKLCSLNAPNCEVLVSKELLLDTSERAQKLALAARASVPDLNTKTKFYSDIIRESGPYSIEQARFVAENLFPNSQSHLKATFDNDFYKLISGPLSRMPEPLQEALVINLMPTRCDSVAHAALQNQLRTLSLGDLPKKELKISLQEDERCLAIRSETVPLK